jgi:hypothetical protein
MNGDFQSFVNKCVMSPSGKPFSGHLFTDRRLWVIQYNFRRSSQVLFIHEVNTTNGKITCIPNIPQIVLRLLSDDQRWAAFEAALNPHLVRVYDLRTERVHVDSTSASAYTSVSEEGLFQFGHSKDHRPDLPQVKIMQAVLDPLGMPLATDVVSGERADDPLYIPCIERVQQSLDRSGLLFVGDCKMAAQDTRAFMALAGDYDLCPLPQVQLEEGEFDEALERVYSGGQALSEVFREQESGDPVLIAQGYEYGVCAVFV